MPTATSTPIPIPASATMIDAALAATTFDANGLVAAIAQEHDTGEVLMMAWMNRQAIVDTLTTGYACYWSRSRKKQWRKGETSGHVQRLHSFAIDCDGDTILMKVEQTGVACHTGRRVCFFRTLGADGLEEVVPVTAPASAH